MFALSRNNVTSYHSVDVESRIRGLLLLVARVRIYTMLGKEAPPPHSTPVGAAITRSAFISVLHRPLFMSRSEIMRVFPAASVHMTTSGNLGPLYDIRGRNVHIALPDRRRC